MIPCWDRCCCCPSKAASQATYRQGSPVGCVLGDPVHLLFHHQLPGASSLQLPLAQRVVLVKGKVLGGDIPTG